MEFYEGSLGVSTTETTGCWSDCDSCYREDDDCRCDYDCDSRCDYCDNCDSCDYCDSSCDDDDEED